MRKFGELPSTEIVKSAIGLISYLPIISTQGRREPIDTRQLLSIINKNVVFDAVVSIYK